LEQLYPTLSIFVQQHSDVHGKVNANGYCPENHMKHIWKTQKLMRSCIYDELRWMSDEHQHSDEEHQHFDEEHNPSWRTQQHSDGQNVHPKFQVKACGDVA